MSRRIMITIRRMIIPGYLPSKPFSEVCLIKIPIKAHITGSP